jgi:ABC-type antimicrobial peptide transport system ATPase subunit
LLAIINLSNTYVLEVHYNNHPNNDALCKGDSSFPYDFTEGNAQRIIIPFNLINLINTSMLSLGDVNSDGFPDILTTLQDSNNNTKAYLLLNIACTSGNKDCEFGSET